MCDIVTNPVSIEVEGGEKEVVNGGSSSVLTVLKPTTTFYQGVELVGQVEIGEEEEEELEEGENGSIASSSSGSSYENKVDSGNASPVISIEPQSSSLKKASGENSSDQLTASAMLSAFANAIIVNFEVDKPNAAISAASNNNNNNPEKNSTTITATTNNTTPNNNSSSIDLDSAGPTTSRKNINRPVVTNCCSVLEPQPKRIRPGMVPNHLVSVTQCNNYLHDEKKLMVDGRLPCTIEDATTQNASRICVPLLHADNDVDDDGDYNDDDDDDDSGAGVRVPPTPLNQQTLYPCKWADCTREESFESLEDLVTHVSEDHVGRGKSSYCCGWTGCSRSGQPFKKRHKLWTHLRLHTGERPHLCTFPNCDRSFPRNDSLKLHMQTHLSERPFACPVNGCLRRYFHFRSLRKHVPVHVDRGEYGEDEMNQVFDFYSKEIQNAACLQESENATRAGAATGSSSRGKMEKNPNDQSQFLTGKFKLNSRIQLPPAAINDVVTSGAFGMSSSLVSMSNSPISSLSNHSNNNICLSDNNQSLNFTSNMQGDENGNDISNQHQLLFLHHQRQQQQQISTFLALQQHRAALLSASPGIMYPQPLLHQQHFGVGTTASEATNASHQQLIYLRMLEQQQQVQLAQQQQQIHAHHQQQQQQHGNIMPFYNPGGYYMHPGPDQSNCIAAPYLYYPTPGEYTPNINSLDHNSIDSNNNSGNNNNLNANNNNNLCFYPFHQNISDNNALVRNKEED